MSTYGERFKDRQNNWQTVGSIVSRTNAVVVDAVYTVALVLVVYFWGSGRCVMVVFVVTVTATAVAVVVVALIYVVVDHLLSSVIFSYFLLK